MVCGAAQPLTTNAGCVHPAGRGDGVVMDRNGVGDWIRRVRRSIITRLLLLALVLIAAAFVARIVILRTVLRDDVTAMSTAHLTSIAEYAARDVEDKIRLRQETLLRVARQLPAQVPPPMLKGWLTDHIAALPPLFSHGLQVVRVRDGTVLAATDPLPDLAPETPARPDWLERAAAGNGVFIGKPVRARDGHVLLTMAVAIGGTGDPASLVLAGICALDAPGFLAQLNERKVGESGGFLLIDPRDGLFVTATDPAKILQPLPPPGVNPLHDRAMAGFRGTGITVNIQGSEELSAIASVPTPGWFLVARQPTSEALAAIDHITIFIVRNSTAMVVGASILLVVVLTRILRPLTQAARQLHLMAQGEQEIRALPVHGQDEIGNLATGFNFLLGVLHAKEAALRDSEARMTHLALHDPLTGLPNRTMFSDRLEQTLARAERSGHPFAVLYLDLDGFKPINDRLGHAAGDAVLRHVAQVLGGCLRKSDTVARIGGDEFAILLSELDSAEAAAPLAGQCAAAIGTPLLHAGQSLEVGASIGIACYPADGRSAGTLMRQADQAMYQAKGRRKRVTKP